VRLSEKIKSIERKNRIPPSINVGFKLQYVRGIPSCPAKRGHMKLIPRELRVYETPSGKAPFDDWLDGLRDTKGQSRIQVRLDRLEQGNLGDCKPVGEGVLELRINYGPGYRVYIAEDGPVVVLLLIGGDKGTQTKDIKTAKSYWKNYRKGA
jgi:putative addiction module killer protein